MSFLGTQSINNTFSSSIQKSNNQNENLFAKMDLVASRLKLVQKKIIQLNEECMSIKLEKDNVEKYLEKKSQENRLRLMGQLEVFQDEVKKKIELGRRQTQKVDEKITHLKEVQIYSLQMILAAQRKVQELEVQLGSTQYE